MILVDYMNVQMKAVDSGQIVDLKELTEMCLKTGIIKDKFIFAPLQYINDDNLLKFHNLGYKTIVCPRHTESIKDKDRVDWVMKDFAERCFDENSDITDIVIVTHDGDFNSLANFMKDRGKKVILFGIKEISPVLIQVVDKLKDCPLRPA